jgi:hypothetical protein
MPVDFIIMDVKGRNHGPIILDRPFLKTTGAIIDAEERNMKFQLLHKKCM